MIEIYLWLTVCTWLLLFMYYNGISLIRLNGWFLFSPLKHPWRSKPEHTGVLELLFYFEGIWKLDASGTLFTKFASIYNLALWSIIFWDFILKILSPYVQTTVFSKYVNALAPHFTEWVMRNYQTLTQETGIRSRGKHYKIW